MGLHLVMQLVNVEGGYRNSQRPSEMKVLSQPQFVTDHRFIQHVYTNETFYKMQFHKKVAKIVAVATVSLFKLHAYLPLFVPYTKA